MKGDPTISPFDRTRLLAFIRAGGAEPPKPMPPAESRIVRRSEAARRLSVSLRTIDNLARSGILKKRTLPNRKRASGFLESDLVAIITGQVGEVERV